MQQFIPCGGCGANHPRERCINCHHDFGSGSGVPVIVINVTPSKEDRIAAALLAAHEMLWDRRGIKCSTDDVKAAIDVYLDEMGFRP